MTGMRVLTVRQPWAWAIMHGGKDVENRSRNLAGDYRGPVAIHAAKSVDMEAFRSPNVIGAIALKRLFSRAGDPATFKESPRGRIIGVVDLVDVHHGPEFGGGCHQLGSPLPVNPSYDPCSAWGDAGAYHLVLSNPRPLTEPLEHRGALGLRHLDEDTTAQILAQIGA